VCFMEYTCSIEVIGWRRVCFNRIGAFLGSVFGSEKTTSRAHV
jgi:hypothetical protein